MATHITPGRSFGSAAATYDEFRPTYPAEALTWALNLLQPGPRPARAPRPTSGRAGYGAEVEEGSPGTSPLTVVDLGAGTGILTRALLALGHRVIAVEPDPEMLRTLAERSPGAEPVNGSAEAIPVADAAADAVLAGQAYHWFDPTRAHPEIARVLRPGGRFAPIWNVRDASVPWVARLTEIIEMDRGQDHAAEHLADDTFAPHLSGLTRHIVRHEVPMTTAHLINLVGSRSYYLTATPERRAEIDAQVGALAAELPQPFAMPYRTIVYRADRP